MGFIKLSSFRAPEDCTFSTPNDVHPSRHSSAVHHNGSMRTESHAMKQYRIEPKYVQDCDLPFISAGEVAQRDGIVMDDICMLSTSKSKTFMTWLTLDRGSGGQGRSRCDGLY